MGSTGVSVSTLALGTMTFGAESPAEESLAMLDTYVEAGGNFIDTADVYADGVSEEIVGEWLRSRPQEITREMVLATKGRFPTSALGGSFGASRRHLRRALTESLRRLRVDHVDLYIVHSWDPITPVEETMDFLDRAVSDGLIGYGGISNYLGWQIQRAVRACDARGLRRPVMLQPSYSLLRREAEWEMLPSAADAGLGVMAWSPLAGGWLTGKYSRGGVPAGATRLGENPQRGIEAYDRIARDERTWEILDALRQVAADNDTTPANVALAWVVAQPGITTAILGARTVEQLRANLAAASLTLAPEHLADLTAISIPRTGPWPYGPDGVAQRSRGVGEG